MTALALLYTGVVLMLFGTFALGMWLIVVALAVALLSD